MVYLSSAEIIIKSLKDQPVKNYAKMTTAGLYTFRIIPEYNNFFNISHLIASIIKIATSFNKS
jgi:hypothetical protein